VASAISIEAVNKAVALCVIIYLLKITSYSSL